MRLIFFFDMIFKTYMTQATCKSAASSLWFYKLHVPHIVKLIVPRIENKGRINVAPSWDIYTLLHVSVLF